MPGELLIRFKDTVTPAEKQAVREDLGAASLHRFKSSMEHIKLAAGRTVEEAITRYRNHPLVEYAEPNYLYSAAALPNDPHFPELDGLKNTGVSGIEGADIDAEAAWRSARDRTT